MNRHFLSVGIAFALIGTPAFARTFTDDQGRTVEADLLSVQGEYVVLAANGRSARWPISKLSKKDQAYIEVWKRNPDSTPKFTLGLWERDGIGPEGLINERKVPGKGLPFVQTKEKAKYKHYDIELTAQTKADGRNLTVAYTLFYRADGGTAVPVSGTQSVDVVPAGTTKKIQTKGLAVLSVKQTTTLPTINSGPLGSSVGTTTNTSRSRDYFGGIWVRVYASDGSVVGERKDLQEDIAKAHTAWTGPKAQGSDIPMMEVFDKLSEFLDKLPELPPLPDLPPLENLPKPGSGEKPKLPSLPGGGEKPKPPSFPPKPPGLP